MKKVLSLAVLFVIIFPIHSLLAQGVKAEADQGTWVSKANMLQPRKDFAAVTHGGKIFAIGGSDRSGSNSERATTLVEIYDPATDSWTEGTSMPTPKMHAGAAIIGNKIYVIGDDNRLFSYDPEGSVWAEHLQLPVSATAGFGMGVVDGKMYVSKGSPTYPSGTYWTYCYDPLTDKWTSKAPLPYHRSIESFAEQNGKLYATGGADPSLGGRTEITRVDIYDPATDSWQLDAIPRMMVHRTHLEPDTTVVQGRIYVIGGWDGYSALSTVEEFNPASSSWETLASMPTARYSLATAVVNGKIYALGGDWGGAGGHLQSVNEEFTSSNQPPSIQPPLISVSLNVPVSSIALDEIVTITASISNQANLTAIDANVEVHIPNGLEIVHGTNTWLGNVSLSIPTQLSFELRGSNLGTYSLQASCSYKDVNGTNYWTTSNTIQIDVNLPPPQPPPLTFWALTVAGLTFAVLAHYSLKRASSQTVRHKFRNDQNVSR